MSNEVKQVDKRAVPAKLVRQCSTLAEWAELHNHDIDQVYRQFDLLCEGLERGTSILKICKRNKHLPDASWFNRAMIWCDEAHDRMTKARQAGAYAMAELSVDVTLEADVETATLANIQSRALRWAASKHNRRQYGDSVQHEVSGGIDLRAAIDAGRNRASMRPMRDITPQSQAQVADKSKESEADTADRASVADAISYRTFRHVKGKAKPKHLKYREKMIEKEAKRRAGVDDDIPW